MRPWDYARRLLAEFPPVGVPIEPEGYIQRLGGKVEYQSVDEAALLFLGPRRIVVGANLRPAAVRWFLAHELAHMVLPGHNVEPALLEKREMERQANEFAAEILMPWNLLELEFESVRHLEPAFWLGKLATIFGVSPEVMRIRLRGSKKKEFARAAALFASER